MEFSLKHKVMRDFRGFLQQLLPWLDEIDIEANNEFGKIVLRYVLREIDKTNKAIFVEETEKYSSTIMGGETMTLAEQFREEGLQKGLQNGLKKGRAEMLNAIQKIAKNLLVKGMPVDLVAELTGLEVSVIEALQKETI